MSRSRPRAGRSRAKAPGRRPADRRLGTESVLAAPPARLAVALAAWAAVLVFAPPASNYVWAVNGFRSVPVEARIGLLVAAAIAAVPLALRLRTAAAWWVPAAALAIVVAFPLREQLHFLGDTSVRLRAIGASSEHLVSASLAEWSRRLHANPLDILVNFLAPIGLVRSGEGPLRSVQMVSALLAMVYFAGLWRLSSRLGAAAESRSVLCLAMAMAGTLEAFAGYAESAGLLLAAVTWWWAEMLAPLESPRRAARLALAWLLLFLVHRLALVVLPAMAWRALGTPLPDDRPASRRLLLGLTLGAGVIAVLTLAVGVGGTQLRTDWGDVLSAVGGRGGGAWVPPSDVLNAWLLVAPLVLVAVLAAGRPGLLEFARRPESRLLGIAVLALLPLSWLVPGGPNGLGAHRDWDLNALLGATLTIAAARVLAGLSPARLRSTLLWGLPVLALQSGAWLAVNAHADAGMRRALALATQPPHMAPSHLSHLYVFLGQHAMDHRRPDLAGPYYDRAFELHPNPRRALLAAEAWAVSGQLAMARQAMGRARAMQAMGSELQIAAANIDALIGRLTADSARAARGAATGVPGGEEADSGGGETRRTPR